jgi:predicted short-subunit dehydrogenase-like oxidoreductase (DUF2520 family)
VVFLGETHGKLHQQEVIHLKIGIIGAGKVGTTLGKYLCRYGTEITGYYSRTQKSADSAATFTETSSFRDMEELVRASDTIFITVPDGEIASVWHELRQYPIRDDIICHFSGSVSSRVFADRESTGAFGVSIHPMYPFSSKQQSYQQFQGAYLTMEGDEYAVRVMKSFWEQLHHPVLTLSPEDKVKYHAAAALASNAMLGVMQTSLDLLGECGFSEENAMSLLTPLVKNNISSMLDKGCEQALTGPVERNDIQTVEKHLEVLSGNARQVYLSTARKLTEIAAAKHPDSDYTELENLLERDKC